MMIADIMVLPNNNVINGGVIPVRNAIKIIKKEASPAIAPKRKENEINIMKRSVQMVDPELEFAASLSNFFRMYKDPDFVFVYTSVSHKAT